MPVIPFTAGAPAPPDGCEAFTSIGFATRDPEVLERLAVEYPEAEFVERSHVVWRNDDRLQEALRQ